MDLDKKFRVVLTDLIISNFRLGEAEYNRNPRYNNEHFHYKAEINMIKYLWKNNPEFYKEVLMEIGKTKLEKAGGIKKIENIIDRIDSWLDKHRETILNKKVAAIEELRQIAANDYANKIAETKHLEELICYFYKQIETYYPKPNHFNDGMFVGLKKIYNKKRRAKEAEG